MQPVSLGAMRQYNAAKQALAPDVTSKADGAGKGFGASMPKPSEASGLAQGVQEFSKVFESVETATQNMAAGKADAHSVVQAMATAEVALETAVTVRNRVVEAYQELLRMPV